MLIFYIYLKYYAFVHFQCIFLCVSIRSSLLAAFFTDLLYVLNFSFACERDTLKSPIMFTDCLFLLLVLIIFICFIGMVFHIYYNSNLIKSHPSISSLLKYYCPILLGPQELAYFFFCCLLQFYITSISSLFLWLVIWLSFSTA